jgi:hypothetical protein
VECPAQRVIGALPLLAPFQLPSRKSEPNGSPASMKITSRKWDGGGARHPCCCMPSKSGSCVSVLLVSCRLFVAPVPRFKLGQSLPALIQGSTTANLLSSPCWSVAKRVSAAPFLWSYILLHQTRPRFCLTSAGDPFVSWSDLNMASYHRVLQGHGRSVNQKSIECN